MSIIHNHYKKEIVKDTIQQFSQMNGSVKTANHDFTGWYLTRGDGYKQMFKPTDDEKYKRLIFKTNRSIYLTLNYYRDNYEPFHEWKKPDFELEGFEETEYFMLSIDIDLKDDHNIKETKSCHALEAAVAYIRPIIDDLSNGKYIILFSGNGIYVHLHPDFARIDPTFKLRERVAPYLILTGAFNNYIQTLQNDFRDKYPQFNNYIKFDQINNRNRLIKTPFSVHKDFNYVVYPMGEDKLVLKEIPLNDEDMIRCKDIIFDFLSDSPSDEDRSHFKEGIEEYIQPLELEEKEYKEFNIDIPSDKIPINVIIKEHFCRAIFSSEEWEDGNIRRISFMASILHHCGWSYIKIIEYIENHIKNWINIPEDLERRIQFKTGNISTGKGGYYPPGFNKLYSPPEPFPKIRFGDLLHHLPERSSLNYDHPLQKINKEYIKHQKTHDFKDGYSFVIEDIFQNRIIFQFYNGTEKAQRFEVFEKPLSIRRRSEIGREFLLHIDEKDSIKEKKEYEKLLRKIKKIVEDIINEKTQKVENKKLETEKKLKDNLKEGETSLRATENPLLWIANEVDWYTAGERLNILYAWIAYCSQVILQNPISVIAIGEGASGKTHIVETALSMIPEDYIVTVKSTTDAALFGFCDEDPYFFDGKIVNIGDMGGKSDHEEAQNFKNAMKELQSDGYMARIKQVPRADGGFENHTYELHGYPCLTYTNVPGHDFDDQEQSRSIFLTPRMDNNKSYIVFKRLNTQKNTKSSRLIKNHRKNISIIKNMVLALQERMENVAIYNPYWGFVEQFLSNTRFLKRDVDKYNGILKVITCLNGFNRKLHVDDDGNKTLFTTNDDVSIFLDLLERYYESITVNLSPAASDLLEELRKNSDLWGLNDEGMTVNKYVEESDTKISKRSIRQYFRELNDQGLVTVIKKDQRSNVYVLNKSSDIMMNRDFKLDDLDIEILKFNYDIDDFSIYEGSTFLDTPLGDISSNPNPPLWNRYLLEARQRRGDAVQQSIKGVVDGKFDIDLDEEFDGF